MKKRLLILMMFLVAIATGSWAEVVSYNLWVAGTQVNSSNATDVLGDGTVSYDASNGTLTLNNASITTACDEFIRSGYWGTRTGIRANQDLTIVLTGSNTIDLSALTYNRVMRHSIFVNGNLTIKGTGSLVARSGAATNNNSSDYRESTAIHAEGTLTFDGDVTVEAVGGTSECDSAGLRGVSGGVVVKGNASVVSEGSAVTVKSRTSLGAWCNVTVQGGSFVGFGKISACGTLTVPTGYYIYAGDDEASATLQSGTSYSGSNAKYVKATGTAVHTHTAGDVTLENKEDPTCTTDGHYDEVVYCTICGEEMSRNTQYIPALGHDLTHVPEVPATTTAEGMKEHYTCSRCTDLLDKNYATVTASDLVIPKLVEPEAYAALSNDNKTLTFYYDGQKASRNGMSVGPFIYSDDRGWHNLSEEITTVVFDASFANYKPTSTKDWFSNCKNLTTFTGIENLKTDEVTDMSNMFYNCNNLTSLDLSSFNTAKVTNMYNMFRSCTRLTSLDLSSFNTGKVTYMNGMFSGCSSLTSLDLSSFNTANVNYMNDMFYTCSKLTSIDLSSFNTSNVTSMRSMFYMCSSLKSLDLGSFNTEKVTDMYEMFRSCAALTRIAVDPDKWDTSKVTNGVDMFKGCYNLVGGNGTTYVYNNTSVSYAVIDKDGTPGYLTDVNAPVVLEAYAALSNDNKTLTFYYDYDKIIRKGMSVGPFTDKYQRGWDNQSQTITTVVFDASFANYKPTSTAVWFYICENLTTITGIENLKTDKVTDMSNMFSYCYSLTSLDLSGFNTSNVTNMKGMFDRCSHLTSLDVSSFNTSNVTNMNSMFASCSSLTSLDVSSFNTAKVENMYGMFSGCSNLTNLDLSSFNTEKVAYMSAMFAGCSSLTSLDLSSFNTANVTGMSSMFSSCSKLTSLNLSSFNTANVEYTDYMFSGCTALTRISVDPEKWNMSKVTYSGDMFTNCTSLVGGNGTAFDENHTDVAYAVIDKDGTPGYLTDVNAPVVLEAYAALSNDNKTLTFYYDYDKIIRKGMSVGPFTDRYQRGWDNQSEEITTVVFDASFANYRPTSTAYWLYILTNLTTITGIENLRTDEVTHMIYMFYDCRSLTNLDLSGFNTSNVTNMDCMFGCCSHLTNLDLSSFNTGNVTNMYDMFVHCSSLTSLDISSFNTEKVAYMSAMFAGCSSLASLDLSNFNTANVSLMNEMFSGCSNLTNLDLSSFNTTSMTNTAYMFNKCTALTKITVDPEKWNMSKVTSSGDMFTGCTSLVGGNGTAFDENHTDVAYAVIDKDGTPGYLTDVNAPVEPEAYAVLSDDNRTLTFYYDMEKASRGGMSVGPFDGSTTLPAWSDKAGSIRNANIDESFAGYSELTSTAYWFEGCSELKAVSGLENLVMDNVTDMSNMFKGCNNLRSVSLSGMNTGKVTNMHGLFWDCNALQSIDLSTLDTRSVTDMSGMFNYCSGLKTVDLSGVNTASVTDMNNMFYYCSSLTDLDLSSFNTSSVTNMRYMFEGCSSLTKITVSETGWTTNAVTSATAMFRGCRDIVGGNGTKYDAGHTDEGYARIDKAGTPGYLTSSAGTGIFNVEGKAMGDGYFYTPDGRRIEGQPTKQGFYISNGRKVMVK